MDISARATSLSDRSRMDQSGHQCSHAPGRPILHLVSSSRRPRRVTVSSYVNVCARRSGRLDGRLIDPPHLEGPATSKNAPGDAGQLIGKRDGQYVTVEPLSGCLEPGLEPVTFPALWPDQHHPRRLNEQDAQGAIAALRSLTKDCAVA